MKLLLYPDPILNEKSLECTQDDIPMIKSVYNDMTAVMSQYKGVGLAAVQVGILKRFCLLADGANMPHVLINPVIVETHDSCSMEEGCLSLPYFWEKINRFKQITIRYKDLDWNNQVAVLYDIEAQCLQHEIDHFEGELIKDQVSPMKRSMWEKKAKKKGAL